ncbi:MAG: 1,4-alpha-glucan branching protein GlgB [Sarcina sp.]
MGIQISEYDIHLFHEGNHNQCYNFMGAHITSENGRKGVRFTTWAPHASNVHIVGEFSSWEIDDKYKLNKINHMGIWTGFIPGIKAGMAYKLAIKSIFSDKVILKSDPYGRAAELRPNTASIIVNENRYRWKDKRWIEFREKNNFQKLPMNIYELHLGSWKKKDDRFLTYRELKHILPKYIKEMGYTHVEFLPIMEHPLDSSWGYQTTGFYAATSRYGNANGLRELIDEFHKFDIAVILDWVPSHFCKDEHGLFRFDGTATYEYAEGWKAENKGWGTANFDLGRPEVRSFLISNAFYWIKEFHFDGIRVDAVANMLYLNYCREDGEWRANEDGSTHNIDSVEFLKKMNTKLLDSFPNLIIAAEESTAWEKVSHPVEDGGLGFNFKWNMGWMNDSLKYVELDPVYRKYHHNQMTFSMMYHHSEKFILPISHDEVVHGKKSLVNKMHGDYWNKFAGLRVFSTYMMGHPGKKLNFMGSEFGQFIEWRDYEELEWKLIDQYDMHRDTMRFTKALNNFYKNHNSLWSKDYDLEGFNWIDADNGQQSIFIFMRKGFEDKDTLVFICNFTSNYYENFNVGVPFMANYYEAFNSDDRSYGGSGKIIDKKIKARNISYHKEKYSINISIPPMAGLVLGIDEFIEIESKDLFLDNKKENENQGKEEIVYINVKGEF